MPAPRAAGVEKRKEPFFSRWERKTRAGDTQLFVEILFFLCHFCSPHMLVP
jgi:hypothetical protein